LPKITKDMVLEGYEHKVEVPAPEYGEDALFLVSSPSGREITEANTLRMQLSGVKPVADPSEYDPPSIDLDKALAGEESAKRFLVAKALTRGMEEEWTLEDVEKIMPVVSTRIWNAVDLLIGYSASAQEQIRNFQRAQKGKN